jgi:hypothetical protein
MQNLPLAVARGATGGLIRLRPLWADFASCRRQIRLWRKMQNPRDKLWHWLFILLATVTAGAAEFPRGAIPADGRLFYASFDKGPEAEICLGFPRMYLGTKPYCYPCYDQNQKSSPYAFTNGVKGQALDMTQLKNIQACFKMAGNICLRQGTLTVWYRTVNDAPAIAINRQSSTFTPLPEPLFFISLPGSSESGYLRIGRRNFAAGKKKFGSPETCKSNSWHHLAFTWNEPQGVRVVIDGAKVYDAKGCFHMGYASVGNLAISGAQFDELRIFDWPLSDEELSALRRDGMVPQNKTAMSSADQIYRMNDLGWDEKNSFIPVNGPTLIRCLEPVDVRELKHYGWRAMDGIEDSAWPREDKTYDYLDGGGLNIRFAAPVSFNYVRVMGNMNAAQLAAGDAWRRPSNAVDLIHLAGSNFITTYKVSNASTISAVSVYHDLPSSKCYGGLHKINFLQASPLVEDQKSPLMKTYLQDMPAANVAGNNLMRLIAWYRPEERLVISGGLRLEGKGIGAKLFGKLKSSAVNIEAWRAIHLTTAATEKDLPLNAVRVQLAVAGWKQGTHVNLRVHDPNNLWRALADVDLELQAEGRLDTRLEFAPTIVPAGTELMLTLISSENGRLLCGEKGASLNLYGPPFSEALASYKTWQHRLLHNYFQTVSEPRPWGYQDINNENVLRVANTLYDAAARLIWDLQFRFPDDRLTRGYMLFTHPQDINYWTNLPAAFPQDTGAPRWAVLQKEIFRIFLDFVNWWTDERQVPNGEFGSNYEDDTDLVQDWPSIAYVYDPQHKYRQSVRKLADYCWNNSMHDGLNKILMDALHAYEQGINAQADAAMMDYGNPVLIERLQATARRYDGFILTPAENGKRRFAGSNFSDKKVSGDDVKSSSPYLQLSLHPGLVLMWYNGNPRLTRLITELYDGYTSWFARDLPNILYMQTGDKRFVPRDGGIKNQWWARILNLKDCPSNVLGELRNYQYNLPHTETLGCDENTALIRYVAWHYTRDKNVLVPALEFVYKAVYYTLPVFTESQQDADRVALKKNLTDFMYLGGIPVSRGRTAPFFAVSYENMTPNFAAMVLDDTPEQLRWVGYNFESQTQNGKLRVWRLVPGTYMVRQGVDTNGDDRIDGEAKTETMKLKRYEVIPVVLPSRKLWIVEAECQSKETPLHQRCDLAVSAEDAVLETGKLTIVAHNLGCKPTGPFRVEVVDGTGKMLASQHEQVGLDSAESLADQKKSFVFEGTFNPPLKIMVSGPAEEITECNNIAVFPPAGKCGTDSQLLRNH